MFHASTPTPDTALFSGSASARDVILLLEDNEAIARMLTLVLGGQGMKVIWCQLGAAALVEFQRHAGNVALVLADCRLPDMDGREVCQRLRRLQPDLPVLVTSGNVTLRNLAPLDDGRLVSFIPKPYTPGEILHRVRDLLQQASGAAA
jgi:DNA-binding response OmpR family regulator